MSPLPPDTDPEILGERILARYREVGLAGLPLREELRDDLRDESRPAVHALLFGLGTDRAGDAAALEHHESLAMVTLLGRALALRGATPTAVLRVVPALCAAFRAEQLEVPAGLEESLQAVCLEGYVRGREEAVEDQVRRSYEASISSFSIAPGVLALRFVGDVSSSSAVEIVEELGRTLFKTEAKACVVDVSAFVGPSAPRARAVASADEVAKMLGIPCVFAGMDVTWIDALPEAARDGLQVAPTFEEAARIALEHAGYRLQRSDWLPAMLRGLLRSGSSSAS